MAKFEDWSKLKKSPGELWRSCLTLANGKVMPAVLLEKLCVALFVGNKPYVRRSVPGWSTYLGVSDDKIERALSHLRGLHVIVCKHPGGGVSHLSLTPDAEAKLRAAFEGKGASDPAKMQVATPQECGPPIPQKSGGAIPQKSGNNVYSNKSSSKKEHHHHAHAYAKAETVPGGNEFEGEEKNGEGSLGGHNALKQKIRNVILEKIPGYVITIKRETFLDRLVECHGGQAPSLVAAAYNDWSGFYDFMRCCHEPTPTHVPKEFDLGLCVFTPECLSKWMTWKSKQQTTGKVTIGKW